MKWPCSMTIVVLLLLPMLLHLYIFSGRQFYLYSHLALKLQALYPPYQKSHFIFSMDHNHNSLYYNDAPWKVEIGRWLSRCGSSSSQIDIIETFSETTCKNNCNGMGVCNRELGECGCRHGYSGKDCSERLHLQCNYPPSNGAPFGKPLLSACIAKCNTQSAFCFCGEGTDYPNRPVAAACGFETKESMLELNFSTPDYDRLFSRDSNKLGWCNASPELNSSLAEVAYYECPCAYEGLTGQFCDIPNMSACMNQCSSHGVCYSGFCQCEDGWYGMDCSIPSPSVVSQDWPAWLSSARESEAFYPKNTSSNITVVVKRRRPLIYMYDLPAKLTSQVLEGRHRKDDCVIRNYDAKNRTAWLSELYGGQMAFQESLLASPHRTLNGEEADYFYVPMQDACIIMRSNEAPHFSDPVGGDLALDMYKEAYDYIVNAYPFWNKTYGRDHIWFYTWDDGACYTQSEIWTNSTMFVHWGNTNTKHKENNFPLVNLTHTCFDPNKDVVLPAWKSPVPIGEKTWNRPLEERTTLFYFNGNLGPHFEGIPTSDGYSFGIRQKVAEEFASVPSKEGKIGRQQQKDVVVTPYSTPFYYYELSMSKFCGVLPGMGWSGRMEDSILNGCIPVIIQDGVLLPYETIFNYNNFAIRIPEADIPDMISILRRINKTEMERKFENIQRIKQRFLYRDTILLEAERQKKMFGTVEPWCHVTANIVGDDAFATIIQILHYKLHNDPWRRQLRSSQKNFGLPEECSSR